MPSNGYSRNWIMTMPPPDPRAHLPLRPLVLEILLLLQREEQHGYALMRDLSGRDARRFALGPATLYRTLKELRVAGMIEEHETPQAGSTAASGEERRRVYRLTGYGRDVARAEVERLQSLIADARAAKLLPQGRGNR
jgi:DNA-binding PadR family transcriptional regulator